ncbi:MAG: hypothetical protein ACE5GW_06855 [Planctomycetota bacterium]
MAGARAGVLFLGVATLLTAGCSLLPWHTRALPPIGNPIRGLEEIVLMPVEATEAEASDTWTQSLRGALLEVNGIDRVSLAAAIGPGEEPSRPLDALGKGAGGVLRVKVLDFDPYYPPSAHVEVSLFVPPRSHGTEREILTLERRGNAMEAVVASPRKPWIRFQRWIRSDDPRVMKDLERYARARVDRDRGFGDTDRILRISGRFIDFVAHEILKECFRRI